jgi:outer membrane protein assembly factor BamB
MMLNASPLLAGPTLWAGNGHVFARLPSHDIESVSWSATGNYYRMKSFIQPSPAVAGNDVVVLGWSGLAALDAQDGSIRWRVQDTEQWPDAFKMREVCSTPACADGVVVWTSTRPMHAAATDARTGQRLWSIDLGGWAGMASPAISGGLALIVGEQEMLGVDLHSGQIRFRTSLGNRAFSSPAISGRFAYLGTEAGELIGIDLDSGRIVWRRQIGVPVQGSPAIAGNCLYVTARDGSIYCFVSATGGADGVSR